MNYATYYNFKNIAENDCIVIQGGKLNGSFTMFQFNVPFNSKTVRISDTVHSKALRHGVFVA